MSNVIPIKPTDRVHVIDGATYYDGRCSRCKRANKWSGFDFENNVLRCEHDGAEMRPVEAK